MRPFDRICWQLLTFGSEGGVEELSEVVGGGGTYIDIGKKKTAKKPNMVKELIN